MRKSLHFLRGLKVFQRIHNFIGSPRIYDVFVTAKHRSVCVIAPYYSAHAFRASTCTFRTGGIGEPLHVEPVMIVDEPERSCLIALYRIPASFTSKNSFGISISRGRKQLYVGSVENTLLIEKKYDLSIATLVKYEAAYIAEWIEHHRRAGVQHFYIYDNNVVNNSIKHALDRYIVQGIVTYIPWPYRYRFYDYGLKPNWPVDSHMYCQVPQIHHALYKYAHETEWMLNGDVDEYFYSLSKRNLVDAIRKYENASVLQVSGFLFGGTEQEKSGIDTKGVVASFLLSEPHPTSPYKLILRTSVVETTSIHRVLRGSPVMPVSPDDIVFNHYRMVSQVRRSDPDYTRSVTNDTLYRLNTHTQ